MSDAEKSGRRQQDPLLKGQPSLLLLPAQQPAPASPLPGCTWDLPEEPSKVPILGPAPESLWFKCTAGS